MKHTKKALLAGAAGFALVIGGSLPAYAAEDRVWREPRACGASYVATILGSSGTQLQVIYNGAMSQRTSLPHSNAVRTVTLRSTYLISTAASVSTSATIGLGQYGCGF